MSRTYILYVGLSHAVNIREQLKRVLQRFKVKMVSCEGESTLDI